MTRRSLLIFATVAALALLFTAPQLRADGRNDNFTPEPSSLVMLFFGFLVVLGTLAVKKVQV